MNSNEIVVSWVALKYWWIWQLCNACWPDKFFKELKGAWLLGCGICGCFFLLFSHSQVVMKKSSNATSSIVLLYIWYGLEFSQQARLLRSGRLFLQVNHVPYLISKTQEDQVVQGRQNQRGREGDGDLLIDLAEIKVCNICFIKWSSINASLTPKIFRPSYGPVLPSLR